MYGMALTADDQAAYDSDTSARMAMTDVRSGVRCVVRICTEPGQDFGLEYGGVIRRIEGKLVLVTRRRCDGTKWKLPLIFGSGNMLMSTPLPAYAARTRPIPGPKGGTVSFLATPAFPSRVIGYVLSEEHAALPIKNEDLSGGGA